MAYAPHVILGLYMLGLLALGIVSLVKGRRADHAEADYYLASRGQGVLTTSLTIMATYFSGFAILFLLRRQRGLHEVVGPGNGTQEGRKC